MSNNYNIPFWRSDKDYYPKDHPEYKSHMQRIKESLRIDKLIDMASSDGSYSVTIKGK